MTEEKTERFERIREFVDGLRDAEPELNAALLKTLIEEIVVDEETLREFILYSDRFMRRSKTFQITFLLHTLASVLKSHNPIGSPVKQVEHFIPTKAINIAFEEITQISNTPEADRYDKICDNLMNPQNKSSYDLHMEILEGRKNEKLDDGSEPYLLYDPKDIKIQSPQLAADKEIVVTFI